MIIKPSAALRDDYDEISRLCRETREPIYLTHDGKIELVAMNTEAFEAREHALDRWQEQIEAEAKRQSSEKE